MNDMKFANHLRKLRTKKNITLFQLSSKLEVPEKTLCDWESGLSLPDEKDMHKITVFFNIKSEELMDYTTKHKTPQIKETNINIITGNATTSGSYVCTWWNQSVAAAGMKLTGEGLSEWRDALCYEAIFGETNYYHIVPKELRKGLIFLLDDGWDLPPQTNPNTDDSRQLYGAVAPDEIKFAQFGNTPEKRLKGISDKLKEMGYSGLGLWISPQQSSLEKNITDDRQYWVKRAKWCHNAGVLYWKVDWGKEDNNDDYRKMMTECVHKYAPGLIVEHAIIQKPCTHNNYYGFFLKERAERVKYQMTFCDAYRTYDLLEPFDKTCTLQRAHEAFMSPDKEATGLALVNAENMYTIAAALGCTIGIMNYTHETAPCIKWHHISPPFSVNEGTYVHSEEYLEDTYYFEEEVCGWAPCKERFVHESAPAIMARNCPLPNVTACGNEKPFVLASKNPKTNAYSVATIRRTIDPNKNLYFLADVDLYDVDKDAPIGVFGIFNSLKIYFNSDINENVRILAQCFDSNNALDITDIVTIDRNSIHIDGKHLRILGKGESNSPDPALVIKLI